MKLCSSKHEDMIRKSISESWERYFLVTGVNAIDDVKEHVLGHMSVYIMYRHLCVGTWGLDSDILDRPILTLEEGIKSFIDTKQYDTEGIKSHLRIIELPNDRRLPIRDISSTNIGTMIGIEGVVRKSSEKYAYITEAAFMCSKCGRVIYVEQDDVGRMNYPTECYKKQDGCGCSSRSAKFKPLPDLGRYCDLKKIELQEPPDIIKSRAQPTSITAYVWDDLVNTVEVGDRVVLNGVVKTLQKSSSQCEMYIDTNSIESQMELDDDDEISDEDIEKILEISKSLDLYRNMSASFAPSLHGYEFEKLMLILQMIGGVQKQLDDGTNIRGDIHVLLVGDPGMAKSQMLRQMTRLAPRSIYASGKSTSAAGLCAAAVKDDFSGRWHLEAGALVLADRGHACIDELDKMNENDRSSMHEAMESQTISVAKAGITAQLKTRCPITGAANPVHGRFIDDMPLAEQINMPLALISRFDVVLIMRDIVDRKNDSAVSEHVLTMHEISERKSSGEMITNESLKPVYSQELLRKYVTYARKITPVMTPAAKQILQKAYLDGRGGKDALASTLRRLESYIRLAEASARLRLSSDVTEMDAERAVMMIDVCIQRTDNCFKRLDIMDKSEKIWKNNESLDCFSSNSGEMI